MQSIFRPASRRETLGKHSEDSRRDGGLKMGWTKPLGCDVPMGFDCRRLFRARIQTGEKSLECMTRGMSRYS